MRLKNEFITHDTGTESLLVPTGQASFSGLVKGNKTLGAMLELLHNDISESELVSAMRERFQAPDGVIEQDVKKLLKELRDIGALDE